MVLKEILIMPCLDMRNGRVVKGVHFVDIRDAGDPVECAKAYVASRETQGFPLLPKKPEPAAEPSDV